MFDKRWNDWHARLDFGHSYPGEDFTFFVHRTFGGSKDREHIRILDLGCGNGPSSWFLAKEGYSVVAVDAAELALERTRSRLGSDGLAAEYVQCDTVRLPFADDTFHCVVDVVCLYSAALGGVVSAIAEVERVLRPNGKLFSVMPAKVEDFGAYEGQGNYTYLSPENFGQIFHRFSTVSATVITRRDITKPKPWLEHIIVQADKHA